MLFSILIPVYQTEKYLPACLSSLEAQVCQDFEVVLVDDGSTDSSGSICDAFAQKHPEKVTVIHQKNQSCLSAQRTSLSAATGKYCIFVDSDDLLDNYCLSTLQTKLEQYDYPDMIIYRMFLYRNNHILPDVYHPDLGSDIVYEGEQKLSLYRGILDGTTINSLATKLISTSLLRSDPTAYSITHGAADLLQTLYPLTYAKRILYTNEPLYYYRQDNPVSFINSFHLEALHYKNSLHVYNAIRSYLPLWNLDTSEAHDRLHARWIHTTLADMRKCFISADNKENKMAVLQFPWHEFVDASRPIPACLNARAAHFWELYITKNYDQLYSEWSATH